MNPLLEKTEQYLKRIAGDVRPFVEMPVGSLPLLLRERYRLYRACLFGRDWLLAMEADGWDMGTPSEYRNQMDQLSRKVGEQVVLVLPSVSSTVRNRMAKMNVPFIVPDAQIFLPVAMINLQEARGGVLPGKGEALSPVAQVLILRQILRGGLDAISSKQVAELTDYSEMAISKARTELEVNRLCANVRKGKEIRVHFERSAQALWNDALPLLRTPVAKRHWIQWKGPEPDARLAGISALARTSDLADDAISTYAMKKHAFQSLLEQGAAHGCEDRHEAHARIEAWNYAPALLADGPAVDPLSLYLSLREDPDERVQSAMSSMMENLPWR
jgi:hypothetical protein